MKKKNIAFWLGVLSVMSIMTACKKSETTTAKRMDIEEAVFASGYIEQENNYTVSAKVDGLLTQYPVKEGDTVRANDIIAIIQSDVQGNQLQDALVIYEDAVNNASANSLQLQQINAQILQAEQQLAFDKENYHRYKDLYEKKSVSQLEFEKVELQYKNAQSTLTRLKQNYEEVKNALKVNEKRSRIQVNTQKSLLKDYQLYTELSGIVIQVFKKQGELVRRGEPLAKIGSGDYIIKLFIAENDINQIEVGQKTAVHINTYPNRIFMASISKIYPAFDEIEQSYVVEAKFDSLPPKIFFGTQLQANIEIGKRKNILVIPTEFIQRANIVQLESGEERKIETGMKNNSWTEVLSGLTEDHIIIKPSN
jgi:macrolide-specific efflux system membrane fusion protein